MPRPQMELASSLPAPSQTSSESAQYGWGSKATAGQIEKMMTMTEKNPGDDDDVCGDEGDDARAEAWESGEEEL